jgi:integrase
MKAGKKEPESPWRKIPRTIGLYQYVPSGTYYAKVRVSGTLYRESLKTTDLAFAKRKLAKLKDRLDRTDPKWGKVSFYSWLKDVYLPTLRGSESTLADKERIVERVKRTWLAARTQPMRDLKPTDVERWLNQQYGGWSPSYYNSALALVRDALEKAKNDSVIVANPAEGLKWQKRKRPIRLTPTWDQFKAIIADVRAQIYNADAQDSADFLEACGLLGLGQAELAGMKREHVDLDAGRIIIYRFKTDSGFVIPIYPQARALIERLCQGKKSSQFLFPIGQARKALANACERLELPAFTHRSLRRMFITRALELGIDVQTIARFQGHKDGGKLILDTYGHVRTEHSQRMAQLMTDEVPKNVVPMTRAKRLS